MPVAATERTSPPIPLVELLDASGGKIIGKLNADTRFRWIERNSREVVPGDLFIAVKGEVHDGHSFVADAAAHGAAAALVRGDWAAGQSNPPLPLIAVPEPVEALQQLAAARRLHLDVGVVGVTGSLGKTSTKEIIAAVLGSKFTDLPQSGQHEQRDRPAALDSRDRAGGRDGGAGDGRSLRHGRGCPAGAASPAPRLGSLPMCIRSTWSGWAPSKQSRRPSGSCRPPSLPLDMRCSTVTMSACAPWPSTRPPRC